MHKFDSIWKQNLIIIYKRVRNKKDELQGDLLPRVDGTGGAGGAQAPPSFLDLYSKNFKISQIRDENFFSI